MLQFFGIYTHISIGEDNDFGIYPNDLLVLKNHVKNEFNPKSLFRVFKKPMNN